MYICNAWLVYLVVIIYYDLLIVISVFFVNYRLLYYMDLKPTQELMLWIRTPGYSEIKKKKSGLLQWKATLGWVSTVNKDLFCFPAQNSYSVFWREHCCVFAGQYFLLVMQEYRSSLIGWLDASTDVHKCWSRQTWTWTLIQKTDVILFHGEFIIASFTVKLRKECRYWF